MFIEFYRFLERWVGVSLRVCASARAYASVYMCASARARRIYICATHACLPVRECFLERKRRNAEDGEGWKTRTNNRAGTRHCMRHETSDSHAWHASMCDVGAHPIWTETTVHCTKRAGGRRFRRHSVRWASVGCAYASRSGANACDGADRAGVVVRQSSGQCGAGREAVMQIQVLAFRGRFAIGCRLLGRMWARAVAPDSRLLTVVIAGTQQQS